MNRSTVIALGFFDGVHIGHGELLKMAVRRAQERLPLRGVHVRPLAARVRHGKARAAADNAV